jgi:hypothetical protein
MKMAPAEEAAEAIDGTGVLGCEAPCPAVRVTTAEPMPQMATRSGTADVGVDTPSAR